MLQFSTLANNARIIWLLSALVLPSWTSICCTGTSVTVTSLTVDGTVNVVVKLEATAKNSSRLKHCVTVRDTTHQLFKLWLQHGTYLFRC
jgi:hypothetical protein